MRDDSLLRLDEEQRRQLKFFSPLEWPIPQTDGQENYVLMAISKAGDCVLSRLNFTNFNDYWRYSSSSTASAQVSSRVNWQ